MEEEKNSSSPAKAKAKTMSNEESLRISTSSSWTILPTERIEILDSSNGSEMSSTSGAAAKATDEQEQQGERGEQEEQLEQEGSSNDSDEQINERCKLVADTDTQAEDVSDGISIISDCESTGRISPHPYLHEHLPEFTYKFNSGIPTSPLSCCMPCVAEQELRDRHSLLEIGLGATRRQAETQTPTTLLRPGEEQLVGHRLPPMVQSGLTAVFYVGVTLAILAFMGRLRNPEWQVIGMDQPLGDLEQKLIELELQNNLMRAEIDIMSKQLQYLNGLSAGQGQAQAQSHSQAQSQSQSQSQNQGRKGKTFKAWPGNGNSVNPVDITKEDLKRPFQCPNGKFVEIAAMCMESMPHAESLADEIGNVVNDVLQQSPTFQNFEKVTEQLGILAGNADEPLASDTKFKTFHAQGEKAKPGHPKPSIEIKDGRDPTPYPKPNAASSKERYKTKYNHKHEEHSKDYSKEHSKEHFKNHSKEHSKGQSKEHSKEQSKDHRRLKNSEQDSKERYSRKSADKSREKAKKRHEHDDDSGSGEWHERMMQHREHARQRHEQKRNNNWYIERGGSREQIRSG